MESGWARAVDSTSGLPRARILAVYVALCESVGALFAALGLFTRLTAVALALSMGGAFYVSLWLGEEPLRAALYLTIFSTLAVTGPGRISLDAVFRRPPTAPSKEST